MAICDVNQQDEKEKKHECFCMLDPRKAPCYKAQLEGHIVAAHEGQFEGKKTPVITLDTGTTRFEILLDPDCYRSLVSELKARGDILGHYNLTLRLYHLPTAPITLEFHCKQNQSSYPGHQHQSVPAHRQSEEPDYQSWFPENR